MPNVRFVLQNIAKNDFLEYAAFHGQTQNDFLPFEVVDAFYFKNADARLGLWNIENKLLESQLALFLYTRAPTELKLAQKHHYWLMLILTWKDYGIARQNIKFLSGH